MASQESFRIMEAFVFYLEPGPDTERLDRALRERHPFRTFLNVLESFPSTRERWFSFHGAQMRSLAEQWLAKNVPDASLSRPRRRRPAA